jgi:hypothetical protein
MASPACCSIQVRTLTTAAVRMLFEWNFTNVSTCIFFFIFFPKILSSVSLGPLLRHERHVCTVQCGYDFLQAGLVLHAGTFWL